MELIKYESRPENWDDIIKSFDSKTLFHESAWHDHIETIYKNATVNYYYIQENESVIGYYCALVVKRFGMKIMGSPLKGTGTNYMGPIINQHTDQVPLMTAILDMCKREKISHLELSNDILDPEIMRSFNFKLYNFVTHKIPVPDEEETAFKNLKSTGRNRVKKAMQNNLKVEILDNDRIIPTYIEQLKEVYGKQGMSLPFGINRVQSLCNIDRANHNLLKMGIIYDNEIIATGLFPYDENAIYFWGAASWMKDQHLLPNELLHWEIIKFAVNNNIKVYNMCGGTSQFKNKFGGEDVEHVTYTKSFIPLMGTIRNIYKTMHWVKLKINKRLKLNL